MTVNQSTVPGDVWILIMGYLSAQDLAALARTCSTLCDLVEEFGWKNLVKYNQRPSFSLSQSFPTWKARGQAKYNTVADKGWNRADFVARPLSQRWVGKLQPLLAISPSRLLLAAGNTIYSYGFGCSSTHDQAPPVFLECTYTTSMFHPSRDITGLAFVSDEDDRTVYLGYADGSIECVNLPPCKLSSAPVDATLIERRRFHNGNVIESIAVNSTHMLCLSSSGFAAFTPLTASKPSPHTISLGLRSWVAHLSKCSSTPYAAFGTTSKLPLSIHYIHNSHISPHPSTLLAPLSLMERPSAVYAIESAPMAAPWGASDQIVVSGWYDGVVRVHDLRSSTRTTVNADDRALGPNDNSALLPVLSMSDPWSFEPIYSLACGGGSMAHIAAGSARHSVVSFWDVRAPTKGWSVHAPGNDSSPVYSLVIDGSRVFGANQSRGFVFDFGMGVSEQTYPPIVQDPLPHRRRRGPLLDTNNGMKITEKGGIGVYVTKYPHWRPM